jgi:hypothetical protein
MDVFGLLSCSAKTGEGVAKAFHTLMTLMAADQKSRGFVKKAPTSPVSKKCVTM